MMTGNNAVFLYEGTISSNPSKWLLWLVNDRTDGVSLYPGDEIFIHSERYEPERLKRLYYDPYQRLSIDPYQEPKKAGGKPPTRWGRFRAGEWDIWRIET